MVVLLEVMELCQSDHQVLGHLSYHGSSPLIAQFDRAASSRKNPGCSRLLLGCMLRVDTGIYISTKGLNNWPTCFHYVHKHNEMYLVTLNAEGSSSGLWHIINETIICVCLTVCGFVWIFFLSVTLQPKRRLCISCFLHAAICLNVQILSREDALVNVIINSSVFQGMSQTENLQLPYKASLLFLPSFS